MDANKYLGNGQDKEVLYLKRHTAGVREHQIAIALVLLYLNGYIPTISYLGEPLVDVAKEVWDELSNEDKIALWSCSTRGGSIFETWQRDALKYGDLDATKAWSAWNRRLSGETPKTREA